MTMTRRAGVLTRGNALFPKVGGSHRFFSVLSFQCQHQTSESGVSLGMMLLVRRSSLAVSVQHDADPCPSGAHTPKSFWRRSPLAWRTGFGLKARERQEDRHLRRPPLWTVGNWWQLLGRVAAHQRGPWERKKHENPGGGGEGEVETVVSSSECLSELTVWVSTLLGEKYCWAPKS